MITLCRLAFMATLAAACIVSESFSSDLRGPVDDGWHTWQVETTRGELRIYTLMASGEPEEIHALRPHCGLTIDSQLTDLGIFAGDESIDWLQQHVTARSDISSDAMAALSAHSGARPLEILTGVASSRDDIEKRKDALHWIAQLKSDAAFEYLERLF